MGKWIVDFYSHAIKLVIEIDGAYHETSQQKEKDLVRIAELEKFGITILRFTNNCIDHNLNFVLEKIKEFILKSKS